MDDSRDTFLFILFFLFQRNQQSNEIMISHGSVLFVLETLSVADAGLTSWASRRTTVIAASNTSSAASMVSILTSVVAIAVSVHVTLMRISQDTKQWFVILSLSQIAAFTVRLNRTQTGSDRHEGHD
jgi:hypothetical protein